MPATAGFSGVLAISASIYGNILSKSCRPALSDALGWMISKCEYQLFEPEIKDY